LRWRITQRARPTRSELGLRTDKSYAMATTIQSHQTADFQPESKQAGRFCGDFRRYFFSGEGSWLLRTRQPTWTFNTIDGPMLYRPTVFLLSDLQDGRRTDALTAETLSDFGPKPFRTRGGKCPGTNANGQSANGLAQFETLIVFAVAMQAPNASPGARPALSACL
jgi:hypothetical protein